MSRSYNFHILDCACSLLRHSSLEHFRDLDCACSLQCHSNWGHSKTFFLFTVSFCSKNNRQQPVSALKSQNLASNVENKDTLNKIQKMLPFLRMSENTAQSLKMVIYENFSSFWKKVVLPDTWKTEKNSHRRPLQNLGQYFLTS